MMETDKNRRQQILDAALRCFLERGYAATSIADIRKASGASTGSIYHFFENKGALALALLDEAVAGWSGTSAPAVNSDSPAETAIKASVSGLVGWGLENLALVRFMDEIRTLAAGEPEFSQVREVLAHGRTVAERRYELFMRRGEVRPLPFAVAHALMIGPAYDFLRLVAGGEPATPDAAQLLADAAWNAVRA